MTPTQAFLAAVITAVSGSGFWRYFGPKFIEWKNRKQIAQERQDQAAEKRRQRERDQWMRESKEAFNRVKGECADCHAEIERIKREEIEPLKRDYAELKDALLDRIQAFDDILPYVTSLPEDTIRELRNKNRAQRQAVFRTRY